MACGVMSAVFCLEPAPAPASWHVPSFMKSGTTVEAESCTGIAMASMLLTSPSFSMAFMYGTLKQGFSNHWLMENVIGEGHAHVIGVAKTKHRHPLVCGPFQVPFLLHMPNSGHQVKGEVYALDQLAVELLDNLERVSKGHCMRRPLVLTGLRSLEVDCAPSSEVLSEAYFAHLALQLGLSRAPHLEAYTKKETVNYVYREDRPKDRTFLEHVNHLIECHGLVPSTYE
ncbi:putative gamma-glutamylcyclotransferase At3g02910 [Physcomitrium patens]|uniref:Gamma-glutamylcyclotransferase family protein n=1 Tax=Physcomitrium patens TaxID=3218 RepID=A0A2K1IBY2_PHYPA|nr:putative gamma-glutamylcyclotransferase At3g02910 [Physcomitrium patens]PNR26779.1 hypothetical protein PHYPA_030260 [Physcomitrium patens]|eukprot:XP_024366296.1 putative gamma-glutamylcyclotransferase At3g02910 [Physcomitrella patens]